MLYKYGCTLSKNSITKIITFVLLVWIKYFLVESKVCLLSLVTRTKPIADQHDITGDGMSGSGWEPSFGQPSLTETPRGWSYHRWQEVSFDMLLYLGHLFGEMFSDDQGSVRHLVRRNVLDDQGSVRHLVRRNVLDDQGSVIVTIVKAKEGMALLYFLFSFFECLILFCGIKT